RPRPRAPPTNKTLGAFVREEAQQGHGLLDASKKFDEHVRSCHNSRRNSAEDLAVVEETPEQQQQQPEDRNVKNAGSMAHVAPAAIAAPAAGGKPTSGEKGSEEKIRESKSEFELKDGDSGYDSQRGSYSQRGSDSQPQPQASKLARMAKKVSPASSRYSQSSSMGRQQAIDVDAITAVCTAVSDATDSCAVDAGDSCCDAGAAC
ncbi:MAG: hypothetical protein L6R38_006933, partial [Xanthoria sp. 2 TBL-2021]